jgi:hypothetical protein
VKLVALPLAPTMETLTRTYPDTCIKDVDCDPYISNRLCYRNASWLRANESECQCNVFYGWQGEDCNQYGLGTILSVVLYSIVALLSLVVCVKGSLRLHTQSRNFPRMRFFPLTAANTTMVFVVVGCLGSAILAMFTILNFVVIEGVPAPDFVTNADAFGRFEYFTRNLAQPLLGVSCSLSQLNVCLMWIDLATATKKLQRATGGNLRKSRRIVMIFEGVLFVSVVAALVLQGLTGFPVVSTLSIPFTLVVIVLYVLGGHQMNGLLSTMTTQRLPRPSYHMQGNTSVYLGLHRAVRKATVAIVITDLVFILALVGYAAIGFNRRLIKSMTLPGDIVSLEKISHHLSFVSLSYTNYILWRYLSYVDSGDDKIESCDDDVTDTHERAQVRRGTRQAVQQDVEQEIPQEIQLA